MAKFTIYFFISLLFAFKSFAENLSKVKIEGNKRISDETIKVYGDIVIGKNYTEEDLNISLRKLYETEFFETIELNLKNQILFINVKEHPIINQLIIIGEKSNKYKDEIKKIIKLKQKSSYIKSYLTEDVNTIKSLYSSLGYNFVEVDTKLNKINDGAFDLLIEINRGERTKISTIKFIGNNKIRSKAIKDATLYAAKIPLNIMIESYNTYNIIEFLAKDGNQNSLSDSGVACLCVHAAIHGAYLNVRINLKDTSGGDDIMKKADKILNDSLLKKEKIMKLVEDKL